jgi:hypothetical protein
MTWTMGELIWLGTIAVGGILGVIAGIFEMRRPSWRYLSRFNRVSYMASLALAALLLMGYVGFFVFLTVRNEVL